MFFETIKCDDFEIFNLDYHNKRVAFTIGKNLNLQEYINPISNELLRCKIIYDENEVLDVQYFPYKKKQINSFKVIFDDGIDYSKKYLNRERLDYLFSQKDSCEEIIILKNGIVTDTTSKQCLLNETTRARLIEDKKIFEKDITLEMLKNASKIALLNAMIDFYIIEKPKISL